MTAKPRKLARRQPDFALALGGGGARGLAHIHAIEALNELGIRPVAISGSSIGALMGAGMAAGMTGKDIRDYAYSVFAKRTEIASRLWKLRAGSMRDIVTGLRLSQFDCERVLRGFLPDVLPETFEELSIPLIVTATDYFGHRPVAFSEGGLFKALAASAAIPAVFKPVRDGDRLLIDGGITNPVPFDLVSHLADHVIAIDVVGAPEPGGRKLPTSIDLMFGTSQIMMQSITALKLKAHHPAVFLRPPVSRFRVLDFLKIDAVLSETAGFKEEVKRAVETVLLAQD